MYIIIIKDNNEITVKKLTLTKDPTGKTELKNEAQEDLIGDVYMDYSIRKIINTIEGDKQLQLLSLE